MNIHRFDKVKGFMPFHEGEALFNWASFFSKYGSILEIGTYCGKSALLLAEGAKANDQIIFTVDHHRGSEEHQINEEYFDEEIFDSSINEINSLHLLIENINNYKGHNIVPIIRESSIAARDWDSHLAMVFIDGSHSLESAMQDFLSWSSKIISGGALVIHDIYENPEEGGQAPFHVYKHALKNGLVDFEREDTIVCLKKS